MAKFGPFKDAYLSVNGVDLSDNVKSLTVNAGAVTLDEAAMGDNTEIQRAGLLNWSVDVTFFQDFTSGSVDATLYPLYVSGTNFSIVCRPTSGSVASGNPQWSGQAFISSYQPMGGTHGDELMAPVTFSPASNLTRTIS